MSVARGFGLNGKSYYANVAAPNDVFLTFTVTSTNGNGVTALKSNGYIEAVYMYTSTTPTAMNSAYVNPIVVAGGSCLVIFKNNFNYYLNAHQLQTPPATSTTTTSTTAGHPYVITALGTATLAQWQAAGLPAGWTPTVGQTFVAKATGSIGGSANVGIPGVATASVLTVVGTPNTMLGNSNIASNAGAQMLLQFQALAGTFTGSALAAHSHDLTLKNAAVSDGATTRVNAGTNLLGANTGSDITVAGGGVNGGVQTTSAGTPAGTVALAYASTAPADGTVVFMKFSFDRSTVTIDGI
jgi:hypothetical protein